MKTLVFGGIKSGKSNFAENIILKLSEDKILYLATTELFDDEMSSRIQKHKDQRSDRFIPLEEPLNLVEAIEQSENEYILVERVSMWLNNMLFHKKSDEEILTHIEQVLKTDKNIVFVLNDVSCCVISENSLVRKFTDLNCLIAQMITRTVDEVYELKVGIGVRLK